MSAPWDSAATTHLYRRAGFGADRERVGRMTEAGREAALEDLFARRDHDPTLARGIRPLLALEKIEPLQAWWMSLILADGAPLVERVALMWHDHFATSWDKVGDVRLMHAQVELFRRRGLGDFRELLQAVATDPAMLVWLDGDSNRRGHPNENFAREVLELFALGIGNYTERDIQETARAFTGRGVEGRRSVFRERFHDPGQKEVFGERGNFDGPALIERILDHPACPRFIAQRLLEEFVHPSPSEAEIERWATVLVECEWNVERTLEELLRSELFFSRRARRSRIVGPVELVATTAITLDAHLVPREAARAAEEMGQSLYRPPSVKGWDGGRTWIHAGSWLARHNYLVELTHSSPAERLDLAKSFGSTTRRDVPRAVLDLLMPDGVEARFTRVLERAAAASSDETEALQRVTALVLTAPEYHLT